MKSTTSTWFIPLRNESKVKVLVAQWSLTFATLWTVASQASLSIEFSRQEYWSGCALLQGDLPDSGIEPRSPVLQAERLFTL